MAAALTLFEVEREARTARNRERLPKQAVINALATANQTVKPSKEKGQQSEAPQLSSRVIAVATRASTAVQRQEAANMLAFLTKALATKKMPVGQTETLATALLDLQSTVEDLSEFDIPAWSYLWTDLQVAGIKLTLPQLTSVRKAATPLAGKHAVTVKLLTLLLRHLSCWDTWHPCPIIRITSCRRATTSTAGARSVDSCSHRVCAVCNSACTASCTGCCSAQCY